MSVASAVRLTRCVAGSEAPEPAIPHRSISLYLCQEISIFAQKKKATGSNQWPFVGGLFLLLDFYFVTFFEGGGNFPREMERKEQMEQRQSPADD